jgi:hypothetical protein
MGFCGKRRGQSDVRGDVGEYLTMMLSCWYSCGCLYPVQEMHIRLLLVKQKRRDVWLKRDKPRRATYKKKRIRHLVLCSSFM